MESLELVKGTVNALQGVTSMRALRKLDLRYLSLEDLSPLCGCKSLEQLELDHCKKIRDLSVLAGVKKLSILGVDWCGQIPSVQFVRELKALRRCSFVETNILDGDLNPFLELPRLEYVGFLKKRHYTHTPEQLEVLLKGAKRNTK